ncbi:MULTISPECIES: phosphoglycerate dehydrogenase [Bacillus]|uniref:D-3-phosphoglycerate dehydrogenase n=2 Tax=Bacillus TaxID=1386 RepID=A0A0M4FQH6_9BACI|nr:MULTISPECIES: phosphoglycerate dehydrogenase [Bacillus]ALC81447.1 D-3-phosphoglycerate dehydrogenase [Bacillus gobiensis]MBP1080485.1 D-3-phosphoglycerate dehydrogenase [Bacillus capparidis]MED1094342.1 phosphoglycerate dehydrogenase [Bacillus capparidis]
MFRVLVSDKMSNDGLKPLLNSELIEIVQKNVSEVEDELHTFHGLLVRSATKVTEDLFQKMTSLKIVARAGVGVDNIDIDEATKHGVIVINAPNGNTISTAEHTFAMFASLMRHIPQANISVKSKEWNRTAFVGAELYGKTLGIVGMGRIGSEIAYRAKAFGMTVHVFDPFLTQDRAEKLGVTSSTFDELLSAADIITVHTPLTKDTKGLLNRETIAKTKKGVRLINCARGGIIDEEALYEALESGQVAGAALDVFEVEPPVDNKLVDHPNVVATPHLGASTKEAQLNVAAQVSEEVLQYAKGQPVHSAINLPAMSKDAFTKIQPYHQLASRIGNLVSQCMREPVKDVAIEYEGSIEDLETSFITKSLLASFISQRVDSTVNEVNVGMIARERGISFSEKFSTADSGYENTISVKVTGDYSTFTLMATHIPHIGGRIVSINGFTIDFYPSGHLIYIHHRDMPGIIGNVGQILGEHGVNIATMQVGRKEKGGEAIMMLSFDRQLEEEIVEKLKSISDIVSVRSIDLPN